MTTGEHVFICRAHPSSSVLARDGLVISRDTKYRRESPSLNVFVNAALLITTMGHTVGRNMATSPAPDQIVS